MLVHAFLLQEGRVQSECQSDSSINVVASALQYYCMGMHCRRKTGLILAEAVAKFDRRPVRIQHMSHEVHIPGGMKVKPGATDFSCDSLLGGLNDRSLPDPLSLDQDLETN